MASGHETTRPGEADGVPAEIYISLVTSLYSDARTLMIGSLATTSAAAITAWEAHHPALLLCAIALALISVIRVIDMRAFARIDAPLTMETARHWELRYVAGSSAYVLLMGVWCLVAFAWTNDAFVQLLSFSMTLVNMIGVAGRNFGSKLLVAAQLTCAGLPMTAALFLMGNFYYGVFGCVLVPFFLSFKAIADRLRRTFLDAVIATRDVSLLANRFDTALNNMPHGLCMFDASGRLLVWNKRLVEILGIPATLFRQGLAVRRLLGECAKAGTVPNSAPDRFSKVLQTRLVSREEGNLVVELGDKRILSLTFQPMGNGGSVVLVEDITERRNAEAEINRLARYDALTGLPNRIFFRDQMDRTLALTRRGVSCAVLFVDLDEFKQVNDTLGHPCGDALLCAVADRLRAIVRESDVVARFGGDEFVVLQSPIGGPEEPAVLARRIVDTLSGTYEIDGHQVVIGASIGIALAPSDGTDADLLLKNADMALYRAKSDGRAGWRFFESEMDVKAQARRTLELDLRNALATDAFEVYYQPIINLKTMRISTCEALLRWPHPERGMISPAEFIPIAEEMGLIIEIGQRVLRKACLECAKWPEDVRVAVNLSPIQFRRGNVPAAIREALARSGLAPHRLEIEITESVLLQDTEATRECLQSLRDLGVRISLDDFGTGYSSLSYLHAFPLQKVKIDRSFLVGIDASERPLTLLRGVAQLSAQLGMCVVVEGVETEEQLALLAREPSINEAQGFLFSRPIPGVDIRKLLFSRAKKQLTKVA